MWVGGWVGVWGGERSMIRSRRWSGSRSSKSLGSVVKIEHSYYVVVLYTKVNHHIA